MQFSIYIIIYFLWCYFFVSVFEYKYPNIPVHIHAYTRIHRKHKNTESEEEREREKKRDECTELNWQPIIELTNVNIKHRRHPYEYYSVLCCYFFNFLLNALSLCYIFFILVLLLFFDLCENFFGVRCFFCSSLLHLLLSVQFCSVQFIPMHTIVWTRAGTSLCIQALCVLLCPFSRYATPFFLLIFFSV